jgi:hypothetical protein
MTSGQMAACAANELAVKSVLLTLIEVVSGAYENREQAKSEIKQMALAVAEAATVQDLPADLDKITRVEARRFIQALFVSPDTPQNPKPSLVVANANAARH